MILTSHQIEYTFLKRLAHVKRVWQVGLILRDVLRLVGGVVAATTVCAMLDCGLAFPERVCLGLGVGIVAAAAGWWCVRLARVASLRKDQVARRADGLLASQRHTVQSALELTGAMRRQGESIPQLQRYLGARMVERAGEDLGRIRFASALPTPELRRSVRVLFLQLAVAGGLVALNPEAARVTLTRLAFPMRDTPPYSRLVFAVAPEQPRVLYGGDVDIGVEITGAPRSGPVWCLTRSRGRVHRAVCFQENGRRFVQRLDRVVTPLEFCFAAGKARSRWHTVELLLQPEIVSVTAVITPPAYTALAPRRLTPGREEFTGYRRSRAELRVVSNRPLLDGVLTLTPKKDPGDVRQVRGERVAPDTVAFTWELREEALVEAAIRDVRGTTNRLPLRLQQTLIADRPPEVSLCEPGLFTLATPSVTFRIAGTLTDDLGLRKADLVRTVVGYRDRSSRLPVAMGERQFEFASTVDLRTLGVTPGQVLEFYAEAMDGNPELTGVSASDVMRVQIITEEEYAAMVRARVTLEEFARRFEVARDSLDAVVRSLEELKQAAVGGKDDLEAKRREAIDTNGRVTDLLEKLAKDFPVFDLEKSLADKLSGMLGVLSKQAGQLEKTPVGEPVPGKTLDAMIEELGGAGRELTGTLKAAGDTVAVGRVMEMAARFRGIVSRQEELVRRLERLNRETGGRDAGLVVALTARQKELRENLDAFMADLREHADGLPGEYAALRESAVQFADKLAALDVTALMSSAAQAGDNQNVPQFLHFATLALEKLRELKSSEGEGCFGGLCEGALRFKVSDELNQTLRQMLEAIGRRLGGGGDTGVGGVAGGGIGGDRNDGYTTAGSSPLNVPMLGPDRTSFAMPRMGAGSGQGSGAGGKGAGGVTGTEVMDASPAGKPRGERPPVEQVPERYRDAVKRYFGDREGKQ